MSNNMQSRKWALVINNPQEANLDHPAIIGEYEKISVNKILL